MSEPPLGPPIRKQPDKPPEWMPVPGKPHLERNAKGQLRTNVPVPPTWPFGLLPGPLP